MEIFKVENISYAYHGIIRAISEVSFTVDEGELFAIIGANGSGKSTLLELIGGLIYPSTGKILFRNQEVSAATLRKKSFLRYFRERVGYIFQDSDIQLFCPTVLDELLYGPLQLDMTNGDAMARAEEVMEMLNISALRDRPTYMLSGGEKKKVAIGSVLTMNPEVLLLDEPANGLDPRTQSFIVELIFALNEAGKTIVLATHDLSLVEELQARVAVLTEGHQVKKIGSAQEILSDSDLLVNVNLIHEHKHFHGDQAHTHIHSHYLFHRHE
jgi:cobalt/nickel transport system ATP-binding protein